MKQGEVVRLLKQSKAAKQEIDASIKILLSLKSDFESVTGHIWKPDTGLTVSKIKNANFQKGELVRDVQASRDPNKLKVKELPNVEIKDNEITLKKLTQNIIQQGDLIRNMKLKKVSKEEIGVAVKTLLDFKERYKHISGFEFVTTQSSTKSQKKTPTKESTKKLAKKIVVETPTDKANLKKKVTRLGLEARKEENLVREFIKYLYLKLHTYY